MKHALTIALIGICLITSLFLQGQDDLTPASLETDAWEALIDERGYDQKTQESAPVDVDPFMPNMEAPWLKYVLIIVLILILTYLLIRLLGQKTNQHIKPLHPKLTDIDRAEEHLPSADLRQLLKQALAQEDYRSAMRIHYLITLQELDSLGWITHGKEKTNMAYVMELNGREEQVKFRSLTRLFEFVWYGGHQVKVKDYQDLSPRFLHFMDELSSP